MQVITALSLISISYKSLAHAKSITAFTSRILAKDFNTTVSL
jgi:hypothetical protein